MVFQFYYYNNTSSVAPFHAVLQEFEKNFNKVLYFVFKCFIISPVMLSEK